MKERYFYMCICENILKGDCDVIGKDENEIKIGHITMKETWSLYTMLNHENDNEWSLDSCMFIGFGNSIMSVKTPVKYCPFCGKKLTEE